MKFTHTLDRKTFIEYYTPIVYSAIKLEIVKENIILGAEFILTAEDILQQVGYISGHFWDQEKSVHFSDIKLTYKQS
jgi:hypothetical protein